MLIDTIKAIMGEIIDFLVTHNEPIFGLSFLSAAVGLGVIEAILKITYTFIFSSFPPLMGYLFNITFTGYYKL